MKLATLRGTTRDGTLIVVAKSGDAFARTTGIAPNLQSALDDWGRCEPLLRQLAAAIESGGVPIEPLQVEALHSPLPRAYEWVDGSAYLNHVRLVRKARNAEVPPTLETDPLVYQGGSGVLLGPTDDLVLHDPSAGMDFESEVCVVLGDTPRGTSAADAHKYVRLVCLANDVTLRNLIPNELGKGFGFFQSKPATAFSPFALTPDELGESWRGGRLYLRLMTWHNGVLVGDPEAGPEMHFSFFELIEHITRTRAFTAGTLVGSGTVSNAARERGISCLAERRTLEVIDTGKPTTPFLTVGDRVEIEMRGADSRTLFGKIAQKVVAP